MRRFSLALALVGAVIGAGCSGGNSNPAPTPTPTPTAGHGDISSPALHAPMFFAYARHEAGATDCSSCHGEALTGSTTAPGCTRCHAMPSLHADFSSPADHGAAYLNHAELNNGALNCNQCHGDTLQGKWGTPSCLSCHSEMPTMASGPHFTASGHNSGVCARCHSTDGFRDLIGADGSASNVLTVTYGSTAPAATDATSFRSGFRCDGCHNSATILGGGDTYLNQHKFASGNVVTMDGKTAICAQCHDGGRPGYEISQVVTQIGATADDTQLDSANNKVVRAHYLPAASTLFGAEAATYVQRTGNSYTAKNQHGGKGSCVDCHNAHTGKLPDDADVATSCGKCHFNETTGLPVATFAELEETRQFGFEGDIDGNGVEESLKTEIDGLAAKLYAAIRAYATSVALADICAYNNRYYYDNGTGVGGIAANGVCETGEAVSANEYKKFTPRLLRTAFNYLMWQNDPGAWAHNPRYVVEVLYDSIADLNLALTTPIVNGKRAFNGHFGAAEDPSPYAAMIYHGGTNAATGEVGPTMGFTSAACYQCHGGQVGFGTYLSGAPAALASIPTGGKVTAMQCSTCHALTGTDMSTIRSDVTTVYFPPQKGNPPNAAQKVVAMASADLPPGFTVCATCHSGRENGASVDMAITAGGKNPAGTTVAPATDANWVLGFKNPHYLGAAGMMLGTNGGMLYQYSGKTYTGFPAFWSLGDNGPHGSPHGATCIKCHSPKGTRHTFEINLDTTVVNGTYSGAANTKACSQCHAGQYALPPVATEFEDAAAELLAAIKAYVQDPANLPAIQTAVDGFTFGGGTTGQPAVTLDGSTVTGICYDGATNPYFFFEVSGACQSVGNATTTQITAKLNAKLMKATYNYQWTQKEPGAWAHNELYVMQAIYDSIVDLGGTPTFTVGSQNTPAAEKRP